MPRRARLSGSAFTFHGALPDARQRRNDARSRGSGRSGRNRGNWRRCNPCWSSRRNDWCRGGRCNNWCRGGRCSNRCRGGCYDRCKRRCRNGRLCSDGSGRRRDRRRGCGARGGGWRWTSFGRTFGSPFGRPFDGTFGGSWNTADEDDARRQDVADEAAALMDAHDLARAQRALKQTDDQRFADIGIGALHCRPSRNGQTAADLERSAFDVSFDDKVAITADLTDDTDAFGEGRFETGGSRCRSRCCGRLAGVLP